MKRIAQQLIRARNPHFSFDRELSSWMLIQFIGIQLLALARGWKVLFQFKLPNNILLGRNVRFYYASTITWGKFLKLGDNVCLSGLGKKGIVLGNNVGIGAYSRVIISTSINQLGEYIRIGNNVGIGEFAYLGGAGGLTIGNDCIIGQYFSCHPENHHFSDPTTPIRLQGTSRKGIVIGKNCWIGSKVSILDGVKIGDNCVIAAGSVVTKSVPDNVLIGGVPAKIINQLPAKHNAPT